MRLFNTQRLRPYSHLPGTSFILAGSYYQVEIFPCHIRIYSLAKALPHLVEEIHLDLKGPIQEFTVWSDLESGKITVGGKSAEGWIRYHLMMWKDLSTIRLLADRVPARGLLLCRNYIQTTLMCDESIDLLLENKAPLKANELELYKPSAVERLSFGNYKAQDVDLIQRRLDLTEIFPIWHRVGQLIPKMTHPFLDELKGTLSLLDICRATIEKKKPEDGKQKWLNLFQAGFHSFLVPQFEDRNYRGLIPFESFPYSDHSPLILLTQGAALIKQMLIDSKPEQLFILPHLLPELPAGSFLGIQIKGVGTVNLEWTKKTIRRMIVFAEKDQALDLVFRSNVRSYRVRRNNKDQGERRSTGSPLQVENNGYYFFDNFM